MRSFSTFENQIEEVMKTNKIPGLSLAVVQNRDVIYAKGFGVTSVEEETALPVTPDTLFGIASVTKPLTTTAIMRLVEDGRLDLDTPIREYLPWLQLSNRETTERLTLRMLLTHMSGLAYDYAWYDRRDHASLADDLRRRLPHHPLLAPVDTVYHYNNLDLNLAGLVAETVYGKPFADMMRELLFEPLGMKHTTTDVTVAMTHRMAQLHTWNADDTVSVNHRFAVNVPFSPSCGAMSTALDLARFAILHLSEGRCGDLQLLATETLRTMHETQQNCYQPNYEEHAIGLFVDHYKGKRRLSHDGGIPGFAAWLYMIPEDGVAVAMMCNRAGGGDPQLRAIQDRIFDALLSLPEGPVLPEVRAVDPDRSQWPNHIGSYLHHNQGLIEIKTADDQLVLERNGKSLPLTAVGPNAYVSLNEEGRYAVRMAFLREAEKPTPYLACHGPARRFDYDPSFTLGPSALELYVGTYQGFGRYDVHGSWRVFLEDGALHIESKLSNMTVRLLPLGDHLFASDLGLFEFHVSVTGVVEHVKKSRVFIFTRLGA